MLGQQTNTNRNVARCMGKLLRTHQPIAALLPEDWPTLPANLLTDPGHVLDHLLHVTMQNPMVAPTWSTSYSPSSG